MFGHYEKHRATVALLGLLLVASISAAQSSTTADPSDEVAPSTFFEALDVHVVNVDVFVTDKKGVPVTDLTADDFEVLEEGRPVVVTNFFHAKGGGSAAPTRPPARVEENVSSPATAAADGASSDQGLNLVVYFDNLFLRPFNRNRVIDHVRRFVATRLGPEDRAMVVTAERGVHVRQALTHDRKAIYEALDGLSKLTGYAVQSDTERRDALRRIRGSRTVTEAEGHADFYAKSVYQDVEVSLRGLNELVASLGGLPGRKAILHVTDGMPMVAGGDLFYFVDQKFTDRTTAQMSANRYKATRLFRELIAQANANRVTFYTLEAAGLQPASSLSAEHTSDSATFEIDTFHRSNLQEPLEMMALDTGGLSLVGTSNFDDGLDRIADDFDSYYSLGYTPSRVAEGRYHSIEVRVRRRGVKVRHRTGYRDKTPGALLGEGMQAALLYGAERNPLRIELELAPAGLEDGRYLVPLTVRIPLANLALIPQDGFRLGRLRVASAAIDEDGQTSTPIQNEVPIQIPEADLPQALSQHFVYEVSLQMRSGSQRIVVGVRDELAGETSFVGRTAVIGGHG